MFDSILRAERARRKLSQKDLAEKAGISRASIANYELGTSEPGINALKAIADAFGMTTDELLGRSDLK